MSKADRRDKGTGSLRKRTRSDGTVTFQLKAVVNHSVYVRTVAAETKTEAKNLLRAFRAEIETGAIARKEMEAAALSTQPTLGEWTETYLAQYMRVGEDYDSTRETYRAAFKHLTLALRASKLSTLNEDDLHNWLRGLRSGGRLNGSGPRHLSVNTVKLVRAAISACLNKAVKRKLLPVNPAPKFADLNLGDGESASSRVKRSALGRGQIAGILGHSKDPALQLWLRIMSATAMRPGEATALTWGDIHFAGRTISIRHSVKRGTIRGHGVLGTTKNASSVREVPMGASLISALMIARAEQEAVMRTLAGLADGVASLRPLIEPDMCIFYADIATKEGRATPRPYSGLRRRFKAAAAKAGLPASTVPHGLRHSAITAMLAGDNERPGVSVADAARIAGHARPSVTSDVYAHAVQANLTRGADLADALIGPAPLADIESLPRTK